MSIVGEGWSLLHQQLTILMKVKTLTSPTIDNINEGFNLTSPIVGEVRFQPSLMKSVGFEPSLILSIVEG